MAGFSNKIVLCKSFSERFQTQDPYVTTLKSGGYDCSCLHTLEFEFINLLDLRDHLSKPELFHGLILTSQRAIESIYLASKLELELLETWQNMPTYCVGPATESFAKERIKLQNSTGGQSGNAKELAQFIIANTSVDAKPFLFPCSEIARDTIEQILTDNGIQVKRLVTYRSIPSRTLLQDFVDRVNDVSVIFVFFSPSSVEYLLPLMKQYPDVAKYIRAVAIGPVTQQALLSAGLTVYATADKPEPISLLQAIDAIEKNRDK